MFHEKFGLLDCKLNLTANKNQTFNNNILYTWPADVLSQCRKTSLRSDTAIAH